VDKTPGQIAYEAYFDDCGGRSIKGEQLPLWEDQDTAIQRHWEAAGSAVRRDVLDKLPAQ
jgi:hypothetical protein